MITVATVLTATRIGRRTSEATPRRTTAPPIMMMGGRMASQRIEGTVMPFDAAWWVVARRALITCAALPRP